VSTCPACRPGSPCERCFRQQVLDYARLNGWLAYFTWTSIHSPAGFPDLILVRDEQMVILELKSEKGKLTESQERWFQALRNVRKVKSTSVRPRDWPLVETLLARPSGRQRRR
jgi:hypothetical protein